MSTRSATIVRQQTNHGDGVTTDELFRFYRHCDGYPDGHGLQMAEAFIRAEDKGTRDSGRWISDGLNNRNWVQKCFAELFADDCDLEVEPLGTQHWDIEYLYVVEGQYADFGGKENIDSLPVTITLYDTYIPNLSKNEEWSYERVMQEEPEFSGTPREYVEKFGKGV